MNEEQYQPEEVIDPSLDVETVDEIPESQEGDAEDNPFREFVHHQRVAIEELGRAVEALLPKEFREHASNAGRAFVDSIKALVDATVETVENASRTGGNAPADEETSTEGPSATKIKVELD